MIYAIQNSSNYLPLIQTLVGGLLTFIGGVLGSVLIQKLQRKHERESIASAFYGEISAILTIVEKRQYILELSNNLDYIKRNLNYLEKVGDVNVANFKVRRNYFNVYENNLEKLGVLPSPLPEKIVLFYTLAKSMLEDVETLGDPTIKDYEISQVVEFLTELIDIFKNLVAVGREIQSMIYPKTMPRTNT